MSILIFNVHINFQCPYYFSWAISAKIIVILICCSGSFMLQNSRVRVMVFNADFNNISVISWQSVLVVEETGVPKENHRPVASHWQSL